MASASWPGGRVAPAERGGDCVESDGLAYAMPNRSRRSVGNDGDVEGREVIDVDNRPAGARRADVDAGAVLGCLVGEQAVHEAAAVAVDHAGPDDPALCGQYLLLDGRPVGRDRVWVRRTGFVARAGAEHGSPGGVEQWAA